jgi:peptidoglycan hydrolase CwlO-like protein
MKKIIIAFTILLCLSASASYAGNTTNDKPAVNDRKENKLSEEEIARLTKRVEEIRDMDKRDLTAKDKKELKKELKEIKKDIGGTVYIGAGTLVLLIVLAILLL